MRRSLRDRRGWGADKSRGFATETQPIERSQPSRSWRRSRRVRDDLEVAVVVDVQGGQRVRPQSPNEMVGAQQVPTLIGVEFGLVTLPGDSAVLDLHPALTDLDPDVDDPGQAATEPPIAW